MLQILFRPIDADPRRVSAVPDWKVMGERGVPAGTLASARDAYEGLLSNWADAFDIAPARLERVLDVEDWSENAVKLVAATLTGLPVHVVDRSSPIREFAISRSMAETPFDPSAPTVFCGTVLMQDPLFACPYGTRHPAVRVAWPRRGALGGGEPYWRSPVLMEALGRRATVASGDTEGDRNYVAAARGLVDGGADELVAKIIFQAKYLPPTPIVVSQGATDPEIRAAFIDALDVNLIDCEGRPECFLLQERVEMEHEYRIAVLGGRPVAGAGAVDWLSPVFHDPEAGAFDPLVEGRRNSGTVSPMPDLVERYRKTAEDLCRKLESEGDERFLDCTMDFALDRKSGRICLIETNPTDNYGLYAMDYGPVMDAMVREASKEVVHDSACRMNSP